MGRLPLTEQVRTSMRRFVKWELQVPHGGGRLVEAWVRRMCSRLLQRCGPDDHVILLRGQRPPWLPAALALATQEVEAVPAVAVAAPATPRPEGRPSPGLIEKSPADVRLMVKNRWLAQHRLELQAASTGKRSWRTLGCHRFRQLDCDSDEYKAVLASLQQDELRRNRDVMTGRFVNTTGNSTPDDLLLSNLVLALPPEAPAGRTICARVGRHFISSLNRRWHSSTASEKRILRTLADETSVKSGISRIHGKRIFRSAWSSALAKRMRKRRLELEAVSIARNGRKPGSHRVSSSHIVDDLKEHSFECGWSNRHQRWKYKVRGSLRRLLPQLRLPRLGYSTICRRIQGGRLGVSQSFQRGGVWDYCKEFDKNLEPTLHKVMNELSKRRNLGAGLAPACCS